MALSSYFILLIGFLGFFIWGYALYCMFFKKLLIDRILSRGKYWQIWVLLLLIGVMPFSLATVAWMCGIQPYDLIFYNNLFGQGGDLESKLSYRQSIMDKVAEQSEDPSLLGAVYFHFQGIGALYAAGTPQGRVWAFFIGIIGTLMFSGLLIPSILGIIRMRSDNYLWGKTRYNFQKAPYAVIFGSHETVPELIHKILSPQHKNKIKYVIVQTTDSVFAYRQSLETRLEKSEQWGTVIYNGGRTTSKELEDLHLERAKEVYVLGEHTRSESESDHDSYNMECIRQIADNLQKCHRQDRLQCYVLFEYNTTFTSFLFSDLSKIVKEQMEFIYINYYELCAQNVLTRPQSITKSKISYLPLEGNECLGPDSDKYVHLIILGMSKMGTAIATEAAHVAHYPNFASKHIRTKITFIDYHADSEMNYLMTKYPEFFELTRWRLVDMANKDAITTTPWNDKLNAMAQMKREGKTLSGYEYRYSHLADPSLEDANFMDMEWEFLKGRVETPELQAYLNETALDKNAITTVAVCMNKSHQAIAAGIYMPREIYRNAIQVLVYQQESQDIIGNLSGAGLEKEEIARMRYNKLRPFGMLSSCFSETIVDNRLAKLVNYVYQCNDDSELKHINDVDAETGMTKQEKYWRLCSVSDQWSSSYNADAITTKLRFLGLDFDTSTIEEMKAKFSNEVALAEISEVEHNRWNTEKLLMGFRPVTNSEIEEFNKLRKANASLEDYNNLKRQYKKSWDMAHLNICSFKQLKEYDAPAVKYDVVMTNAFPAIVETMRKAVG